MQENQQRYFLLSPVYISFQSSVEMKNLHTSHRIEKPHLLDYSYLIFTSFLSFFDDCHTHWQAVRVQMLPVTKLARNFVLALPKFRSLNKRTHSTKTGKHNFYECSLAALPLPAAPGSLRVLLQGNYSPTASQTSSWFWGLG